MPKWCFAPSITSLRKNNLVTMKLQKWSIKKYISTTTRVHFNNKSFLHRPQARPARPLSLGSLICNVFIYKTFNKFVKLNWLAEPELSPLFNVLFWFSSGSSSLKVKKNFQIIFHPSQTELNHTKPNSSIPNRTQPHQTKLIQTKPNKARQFPTQTGWVCTVSYTHLTLPTILRV